jgi:hypothetical protein
VCWTTAAGLIKSGQLPSVSVNGRPRVLREAFEAWIQSGKGTAPAEPIR